MTDSPLVMIGFPDINDEAETMWASELGDGTYQIDNVPWFTYGISLGDVVVATVETDGALRFRNIVRKSGNRTLRVILDESVVDDEAADASRRVLRLLEAMGCGWEEADGRLIPVNVPVDVELNEVTQALEQTGVRWEYADPTADQMGMSEPDES